jgi:precorrin-8X/cobalt-precorrin-8 methylmutase
MVDWSATSHPAKGADSIWYCLTTRSNGKLRVTALENPPTRCQATSEIRDILLSATQRGMRVLAGFDFPLGYPVGFAGKLGITEQPAWRAVWREIASKIIDRKDNSNNRFEAAAAFNRRISGGCYPFWACPQGRKYSNLLPTKGAAGELGERRITDIGAMQPIWKLFGNGSVGSQALVGIPRVLTLRDDPALAAVSCVWPFETGLRALNGIEPLIVYAEIYPSLLRVQSVAGEVKDAAQVRQTGRHFAELDQTSRLAELFAGRKSLLATQRAFVECEEGWTLGIQ